jgi:hypothetical protein
LEPYQFGQSRAISERRQSTEQRPLCAVCGVATGSERRFSLRDLAALNASRVNVRKSVIEMPERRLFKCEGCRKALDAVAKRLDEQPALQKFSPAKVAPRKRRPICTGEAGDTGEQLRSRHGSCASRDDVWGLAHQANDDQVNASLLTLSENRSADRAAGEAARVAGEAARALQQQRQEDERAEERSREEERRTVARAAEGDRRLVARDNEEQSRFGFFVGDRVLYTPLTGPRIPFEDKGIATITARRNVIFLGNVYDLKFSVLGSSKKDAQEPRPSLDDHGFEGLRCSVQCPGKQRDLEGSSGLLRPD